MKRLFNIIAALLLVATPVLANTTIKGPITFSTVFSVTGSTVTIPQASSSVFGVAKVDNTTITASGGVLSAVAGGGGINQLTSDVLAGPGIGSQAATLATVNSNVGSFTYPAITVDGKGRITAAANGSASTTVNGTTCTLGSSCTPQGAVTPLTTGTSVTMSTPRSYFVCTSTCTITVPVPSAGYEFCVRNGNNVATVITFAGIGASAMYEKPTFLTYGTASTGTAVSSGAAGDKLCLVGLDNTHYIIGSISGTWVMN